jgi:hypothetical protein
MPRSLHSVRPWSWSALKHSSTIARSFADSGYSFVGGFCDCQLSWSGTRICWSSGNSERPLSSKTVAYCSRMSTMRAPYCLGHSLRLGPCLFRAKLIDGTGGIGDCSHVSVVFLDEPCGSLPEKGGVILLRQCAWLLQCGVEPLRDRSPSWDALFPV